VECPNCKKTDKVTIGNKNYCAICGSVMPDNSAPTSGQSLTDIRPAVVNPVAAVTSISIPVATAAAVAAPDPAPAPPTPNPAITAPAASPMPPLPITKPADNFHAKPQMGAVLDLRLAPATKTPEGASAAVNPAKVTASVQPSLVKRSGTSGRLDRAAAVEKSQLIKRFPSSYSAPVAVSTPENATQMDVTAPAPVPTPSPVTTPAPQPNPLPTVKVTTSVPIPDPPQPIAAPLPAANPAPMTMPNSVATQLASIKPLDTPETRQQIRQDAAKKAMAKTGPSPAAVAVVAVIVAVMGGYVWLTNYPHMAAKLASGKAGIEASLPGYMPTSYRLKGPISYSPGQVKFKFSSAGASSPLVITARRTHWDSSSLLENYVSKQSSDYLTMNSQGLTIYFYNGNNASWINQGLWYSLEGNSNLSREQMLKIIDSL
jgi:hypothetical protein